MSDEGVHWMLVLDEVLDQYKGAIITREEAVKRIVAIGFDEAKANEKLDMVRDGK